MTVLTEKNERASPYMFTANENWSSQTDNERNRRSALIRYLLASASA
jgi:hypothetical protein